MLRRVAYFVRRALASIRATPLLQLLAVSTIAVALLVLGVFLVVIDHVDRLTDRWGERASLVAFLADDVPAGRADELRRTIEAWPGVARVTVRDRPAALADLRDALGADQDLLEGVEPDLLPASVELALEPGLDDAEAAAVAERLRALPGLGAVEAVDDGADLVARVRGLRDVLRVAAVVLGTLVFLAVVFIVSNTIRLTLFGRREEIEIMQLVGATHAFIRALFYIEGALQGLGGAGLALLLLWGLYRLTPADAAAVTGLPVRFLPVPTLVGLALGAAAVGVLSSHFAVGRYLRSRGAE